MAGRAIGIRRIEAEEADKERAQASLRRHVHISPVAFQRARPNWLLALPNKRSAHAVKEAARPPCACERNYVRSAAVRASCRKSRTALCARLSHHLSGFLAPDSIAQSPECRNNLARLATSLCALSPPRLSAPACRLPALAKPTRAAPLINSANTRTTKSARLASIKERPDRQTKAA